MVPKTPTPPYQHQAYPAWRYHPTAPARLIRSVDEEPGEGWTDTTATDPLVVDEPEPPAIRTRKAKTA